MNEGNVVELFCRAVDREPGRAAIEFQGRRLTYGELEQETNRLANLLLSLGAAKGSLVAVCSAAPLANVVAMIAILKAGSVFVPLDPTLPAGRAEAMLAESSPQWLLTDVENLPRVSELIAGRGAATRIVCLGEPDGAAPQIAGVTFALESGAYDCRSRVMSPCGPDEMCYLFFTSGSTGRPKGIAGRLKAIDHFIRWEVETFEIPDGAQVSQLTLPVFDAFLRDVFVPLGVGGTIRIPDGRDTLLDAHRLIEWIDRGGLHVVHCVPSVFRAILNGDLDSQQFASLRHVFLAGEPVLPADVGRWIEVFGDRIELVNLYGPSETTMTKLFYRIKASDKHRRSIPIGKPMRGAKALVVGEKEEPCPPGKVGEIYIRTPYRSLGYYRQPEMTNAVFIQNPFSDKPQDIIYKTGDMGRVLEDGDFEFLGRRDQQVKIRGVRVEMGEIEDLLRRHPGVEDVAVVDRADAAGNRFLCAYTVQHGDLEPAALRQFLGRQIPEFMMPSVFVRLEALPRTPNGKVDRRALPAPNQNREALAAYVAPRTPLEERLAALFGELLGITRVGISDSFFDLGGHSLLATQLLSRIRSLFQVEVPLRVLFAKPFVADLALAITQIQAEQEDAAGVAMLLKDIQALTPSALDEMLAREKRIAEGGAASE
ncbi:MAG TPA: non-ribosomal peptide synthetase [Thermoanaerobaculia bacterium]|nr:non-ribosomal peptide synthetase [Thermoanaerobaculia bacterium]